MKYEQLFTFYAKIPPLTKNSGWFDRLRYSLPRFMYRKACTDWILPHYYRRKHVNPHGRTCDVVISLTSFPVRINNVWLCIESLKHQEVKPEKILLYLSKDQFNGINIPKRLAEEQDSLFEIRWVDGDIRSHKKYYYAMRDYSGKCIVTCDDDVVYPPDMLKLLYDGHEKYPNSVIANYTCLIALDKKEVLPYSQWGDVTEYEMEDDYYVAVNQVQIGVGGVLYPPDSLYQDTLDIELAKRLSYYADDLWLYAMTALKHQKVVKTRFDVAKIIPIVIKGNQTLTSVNVGENKNDLQFKQIRVYYLKQGKEIVNMP